MRWFGACAWMVLSACTAPPSAQPAALEGAASLVVTGRLPGGGPDAPDRVQLAFRSGAQTGAPLAPLAIGWVPRWGRGAALVDAEGHLYEVLPEGGRRMLADGVVGPLGTDGTRLAYTTESGFLTDLHVHDGQASSTWARDLAGAGALRFERASLFFVGGPPGAVVGLWEARQDASPRCLSNCDLRTGTDFSHAFVPPPGRAEDITVTRDHVRWVDAHGDRHEVAR